MLTIFKLISLMHKYLLSLGLFTELCRTFIRDRINLSALNKF